MRVWNVFLLLALFHAADCYSNSSIKVSAAKRTVAVFSKYDDKKASIGDQYVVYRIKNTKKMKVGVAQIIKIYRDKIGIKLLPEYQSNYLEYGDILEKIETTTDDEILSELDGDVQNNDIVSKTTNKNIESWYTYWGGGYSNTRYPDETEDALNELEEYYDATHISIVLDLLGIYFPKGNKTILGIIVNGWGDRYQIDDEYMQINGYLFSASIMHFLNGMIGSGPFIRGDIGFSRLGVQISEFGSESSDTGFGALLGGGIGVPITNGTRVLFNLNYSIRKIDDFSYGTLGISVGGLF